MVNLNKTVRNVACMRMYHKKSILNWIRISLPGMQLCACEQPIFHYSCDKLEYS